MNWKGAGKESAIMIALLNTEISSKNIARLARSATLDSTDDDFGQITRVAMKSAPRQGAEFAIEAAKILDGNEAQFQKLNHIRSSLVEFLDQKSKWTTLRKYLAKSRLAGAAASTRRQMNFGVLQGPNRSVSFHINSVQQLNPKEYRFRPIETCRSDAEISFAKTTTAGFGGFPKPAASF